MTNYNEKITQAQNLDEVKTVLEGINNAILDNETISFDVAKIEKKIAALNEDEKNHFSFSFCFGCHEVGRKATFEKLVKTPNYDKYMLVENDNGTYTIKEGKALFKFADLEKYYQLAKSTETDKNGKKITNKSVTVFGAKRFYGLCECFIRNLFTTNLVVDGEKVYDLSKVKIAEKTIFDENDGKCFGSTSNNALEKQLNILARFFEIDVKMLKRDLPILKMAVQKIKRDVDSNKPSVRETSVIKFADILFSVIANRYNGFDVEVITNDGKTVKVIAEATKTEAEATTETATATATETETNQE